MTGDNRPISMPIGTLPMSRCERHGFVPCLADCPLGLTLAPVFGLAPREFSRVLETARLAAGACPCCVASNLLAHGVQVPDWFVHSIEWLYLPRFRVFGSCCHVSAKQEQAMLSCMWATCRMAGASTPATLEALRQRSASAWS